VVPYFYNVGRPPNFVILNENHHFTVYGVDDPAVFESMPARREIGSFKPEPLVFEGPYQEFVNYFAERDAIVHAVHVESVQDMWVAGLAHFIDRKHPEFIYDMKGLTGFSALPEAFEFTPAPGGAWDAALLEYLLDARARVPWAVGDADYHGPDGSLAQSTTLFYLREFTVAEVYRALREGRMAALMGDKFQDTYVSEFSAGAEGEPPLSPIMFGEKILVSSPAVIRFRLNREPAGIRTELIRNGKVILTVEGGDFEFLDREMFEQNLPAVYRVRISDSDHPSDSEQPAGRWGPNLLFTNPLFVYPAASATLAPEPSASKKY
jgi:hypothetical protein